MALQLCRICGNREDLLNILEQGPTMLEKLSKCANIEISPDDFLPKLICRQCDRMLDMSYQLRRQSESMQEKLQQELQKQQDAKVHYISDVEVTKSEIVFKEEQVTSSHIGLNQDQKNTLVSAVSTVHEFTYMEQGESIDTKTESTVLASETENVDELDALLSAQMPAEQTCSPTSADDIESNESFDLAATPKKIVTDEDELVDVGQMNDDLTHDSHKFAYPSVAEFCSIDLLSNPGSPTADIDHEELKTDSQSSSSAYTCGTCNETFTRKRKYQEHIQQHGLSRYQCIQCLACFPTRYRLNRHHDETHTGGKRYNCGYCKRTYTVPSNLQRHINACHSKEETFMCDTCHISFARQDVLRRHVQQVHCKKWHCKNCGESFRSAYFLSLHKTMANCYEEPPSSITVKPNGLLSYPLPSEYIIKASNDKYKCIHCSVLFKTLSTYRNHLLIHQNVRPFPCTTCPKAFRTRYALANHERIHSNERPFKCDLCPRSFRQVTHLKHHRYQHTKDKMPFHCTKCKLRFVTKWKLRDHLRRVCAEKAFKCAECSEEFYLKYDLKRHARSVHYRSVDIVDSDNEGNQKNPMDFTEGTTETDKTDDERITENELYDNNKDDVIDILDDDDDEEGIYGESSNSMQENLLVLNEAEPASLGDVESNSFQNNLGMAPNYKKYNAPFQTSLPPNLHSENANEPQVRFINFDAAEPTSLGDVEANSFQTNLGMATDYKKAIAPFQTPLTPNLHSENANEPQVRFINFDAAEPTSLGDVEANSFQTNLGMATDYKKAIAPFQTPLTPNLHSENANEPQVRFIHFNAVEVASATASIKDGATNVSHEKTILDYIDLEEETTAPEAETLNEPFNGDIPTAIASANAMDVINLDDDDNDEEFRPPSPQTSNVLVANEPMYMNYMPEPSKPMIISSMLLKSADQDAHGSESNSPKVANENVVDFIHIDSSNSCKSPPRHFNNENGYYENGYGEDQQHDEYDTTIIEEKIQITEEKIETFTSFYNI